MSTPPFPGTRWGSWWWSHAGQPDTCAGQGFWSPLPNGMAGHAGCQQKMSLGMTHPIPCAKHLRKEEQYKEQMQLSLIYTFSLGLWLTAAKAVRRGRLQGAMVFQQVGSSLLPGARFPSPQAVVVRTWEWECPLVSREERHLDFIARDFCLGVEKGGLRSLCVRVSGQERGGSVESHAEAALYVKPHPSQAPDGPWL